MALINEEKLQKMERVHERVLRDTPDDIVALTMRDAVETIRAAWDEVVIWKQRAAEADIAFHRVEHECDEAMKLAEEWRKEHRLASESFAAERVALRAEPF